MNNEKLTNNVYKKINNELLEYMKEIKKLSPDEIIKKSYETTCKEEFVDMFYNADGDYETEELIAELRNYYDIIILDCPPVLGMSDTQVLTKISDANMVVVSSGKTSIELLGKVKRIFETANSKISGVVINKAKVNGSSYHSYYTNDYYSKETE